LHTNKSFDTLSRSAGDNRSMSGGPSWHTRLERMSKYFGNKNIFTQHYNGKVLTTGKKGVNGSTVFVVCFAGRKARVLLCLRFFNIDSQSWTSSVVFQTRHRGYPKGEFQGFRNPPLQILNFKLCD